MQNVITLRHLAFGLAALLITAASFSASAVFSAPAPGSNLEPVGGAELLIDLIQGQEHLLWSSLSGNVTSYEVLGWPTSDGEHDLGGALVIERPENGLVGVIDFGEKPMSAEFSISG
ncbi:MAG: hypothetical protein U9N56_06165 [Actinomycetota bacterium]|nr:hypothetical protein [Actinomycetota bacterium]